MCFVLGFILGALAKVSAPPLSSNKANFKSGVMSPHFR